MSAKLDYVRNGLSSAAHSDHVDRDTCNHLKKCACLTRVCRALETHYHIHCQRNKSDKLNNSQVQRMTTLASLMEGSSTAPLINDYQHILVRHLSHTDHDRNMKNINHIRQSIHVECDLETCAIFRVHQRNKLSPSPSCSSSLHELYGIGDANGGVTENAHLVFISDFLCAIHAYFVHAIDAGFRSNVTRNIYHAHPRKHSVQLDQDLINQLLLFNYGDRDDIVNAIRMSKNKHDVNEIIDTLKQIHREKERAELIQLDTTEFYEDEQMINIKTQCQLGRKRKLLADIRGEKRMKYNKFYTEIKLKTNVKTAVSAAPRRTSSKMNKLLPSPDVDISSALLARQTSAAEEEEEQDLPPQTFKAVLNSHLAEVGIGEDFLDQLNEWMLDRQYDTDAIIEDVRIAAQRGDDESNLHQYCTLKNQKKCFNHIKHYVHSHPTVPTPTAVSSAALVDVVVAEVTCTPTAAADDTSAMMTEKDTCVKREKNEYVFGHRYFYWPAHKTDAWYVSPHYHDLKQEILRLLPVEVFTRAEYKTRTLLRESDALKAMVSGSHEDGTPGAHVAVSTRTNLYGMDVAANTPLDALHLLAIVLYADCDELAYELKRTFVKLHADETDDAMKTRHARFWHWSKTLTESVELYGTVWRFSRIPTLYHCTSFMYYSLFTAMFNAPTSMTRYLEVAAVYCDDDDGVVLEMSQYPKIWPKYFDCALVSDFGYEHELLFMPSHKSMDIEAIRVVKHNEDHTSFVKAMRLFIKVTNAAILSPMERCEITDSDYEIMHRLMQPQHHQHCFPEFMKRSFAEFCRHKKKVRMDVFCLSDSRYYRRFGQLFLHKYHRNLLQFDYICQLFPSCPQIESWDTGEVTSLYLTALKNILAAINRGARGGGNKLSKIVINCDFIDRVSLNLTLFKRKYKEHDWCIHQTEPCQLIIFKH